MQIPIGKMQIKEGRRSLAAGHVKELAVSIQELGFLTPHHRLLITGLHRLEAVKSSIHYLSTHTQFMLNAAFFPTGNRAGQNGGRRKFNRNVRVIVVLW